MERCFDRNFDHFDLIAVIEGDPIVLTVIVQKQPIQSNYMEIVVFYCALRAAISNDTNAQLYNESLLLLTNIVDFLDISSVWIYEVRYFNQLKIDKEKHNSLFD